MGATRLKKNGARLSGLGAALAIVGSMTMAGASANPSPPQCEGPYNPGAICTTGTHTTGEYFRAPLGCDKTGRAYVDNATMETRHGTVGWYTWSCVLINAGGDDMYQLNLHGWVYK